MRMQYDRQITVSIGTSRKDINWKPKAVMLSDLYERLKTPQRDLETLDDYFKLKKAQQDDLKDVGGFVGGTISGGRRKSNSVIGRDIITLDFDSIPAFGTEGLIQSLESIGYGYCVYSTRKHVENAPRLRIIVPLDRTVSAEEYEAIARRIASYIGIQMADPTTFEPSRLMYWPSCCADSNFCYAVKDAPFAPATALLETYTNWHDWNEWPQVPGTVSYQHLAVKQGDPESKPGIVGAFNRVCAEHGGIEYAMQTYLPGIYEPCANNSDRYTFTLGSTTGGAVLYDGGKFLFSHHATDPCGGKLVNCFDLVRLHKFGNLDDDAAADTPSNRLPSYKAMCDFAVSVPDVSALMVREKAQEIQKDFADIANNAALDNDACTELAKLTEQKICLAAVRCLLKVKGYQIRTNAITKRIEVTGIPSEQTKGNAANVLPVFVKDALNELKIKGATDQAIGGYLSVIADANHHNPVTEMLESGEWDGTDRLSELYTVLGLSDDFEKTLVRKWLVQCVALAYNPETDPIGADGVLVLQGPQGCGKTEFFRRLAVNPDWFQEGLTLDMAVKDSIIKATGCWICELGELDSTTRKEQSALKAFLTSTSDTIRAPYAREQTFTPRRTSFCGTVNPQQFLPDSTGNRRYWVIPASGIDKKHLFSLKKDWFCQLWKQIYSFWRVLGPDSYRLTDEERQKLNLRNQVNETTLPGEDELLDLLEPGFATLPLDQWEEYSASEINARLSYRGWRGSTQQIGRALTKISERDSRVVKNGSPHKICKYILPLKR